MAEWLHGITWPPVSHHQGYTESFTVQDCPCNISFSPLEGPVNHPEAQAARLFHQRHVSHIGIRDSTVWENGRGASQLLAGFRASWHGKTENRARRRTSTPPGRGKDLPLSRLLRQAQHGIHVNRELSWPECGFTISTMRRIIRLVIASDCIFQLLHSSWSLGSHPIRLGEPNRSRSHDAVHSSESLANAATATSRKLPASLVLTGKVRKPAQMIDHCGLKLFFQNRHEL